MAQKRIHIFYSGRVQGVGFRFTAEDIALELGLTGWVRNMRDGRVEVVCEGEEKKLQEFIEKIRLGPMRHYVKDVQISWLQATGEFDGFHITY